MIDGNSVPWYGSGLHFECMRCGGCCCGPGEGYLAKYAAMATSADTGAVLKW